MVKEWEEIRNDFEGSCNVTENELRRELGAIVKELKENSEKGTEKGNGSNSKATKKKLQMD